MVFTVAFMSTMDVTALSFGCVTKCCISVILSLIHLLSLSSNGQIVQHERAHALFYPDRDQTLTELPIWTLPRLAFVAEL